jgi:metal-dependent HD superfamily phosphatase/phosphodiesterase
MPEELEAEAEGLDEEIVERIESPASDEAERDTRLTPAQAVEGMRIRVPERANRKLRRLVEHANTDTQLKAWWHVSNVNAVVRMEINDHSWVHIQIVTNIALRLSRLLARAGIVGSVVTDHGMTERDAEVVIAAGALFHCVGMSIHRTDHESYSLFLTADKLNGLLSGVYQEPERSVVVAEAMHAVISHRSTGRPLTIEGAIVRVADALDMAKGRSRVEFEAGRLDIHSISAYAIDEVRIAAGEDKAIRVEIEMSNSAGIFQVDEGLGAKLRGTPLAEHIEVIARIEGEHEKRLVPVFRLQA